MPAFVVITRERTRDQFLGSTNIANSSFNFEQPAKFRAIQGRHQVLEGSAIEEIIILEFPTFKDAA